MDINYGDFSVLFVDDEEFILKAIERDLRNEAFHRYYARDAAEARKIIENEDLAVVVVDMQLPDVSGLDLLQQLSETHPYTTRIILSGNLDSESIINAIEKSHIFRYLTKPWHGVVDLVGTIYQAIGHHVTFRDKELRSQELLLQNKALTQLNKRLKEARESIVELERKNTALAMGVTANHELNQPLLVLSASLEMLEEIIEERGATELESNLMTQAAGAMGRIKNILKKFRESAEIEFGQYLDKEKMLVFRDDSEESGKIE